MNAFNGWHQLNDREKTLANGPIANVSDDDFVGINRFTTSQTYHGRTASGLKEIRGDAIRRISIPRTVDNFNT
jgi:hypothetical protein